MWCKQKKREIYNFKTRGAVSFLTSLKLLAHETLMLKSNFDSIDGKFIEFCNMQCCLKFQEICLSLSRSKRRANVPITRGHGLSASFSF